MPDTVVLLSVPGLRQQELEKMPHLAKLTATGDRTTLVPSFPAVTCPVQVNMTTGKHPRFHGVIANGYYWRDRQEVEMWTAWNDVIQSPQIWDILHQHNSEIRSAVWFPLLSKGCGADFICTPAPIHNPDGSESLWCYTRPTEMYGELRDALGHFPLQHFWGPMANIKSTAWIVDSAIHAAKEHRPNFFYIYLPHLDYAAQKYGPDSVQAQTALVDLDNTLGKLFSGLDQAYGVAEDIALRPLYIVASEYAIVPVDHVSYPNRVLREAGLLKVRTQDGGEVIDFQQSAAWALADHQLSHVFVKDRSPEVIAQVCELFKGHAGIAEVLSGVDRQRYELEHEHSGDVILISTPNSWQAYYYWLDDANAPAFARTVDIHRKPGYDPVEMHFDTATKSIPLDATLVKGSHGAPAKEGWQRGVILTSEPGVLEGPPMMDIDVFELVLRQFGI
ncbi:MAG: alkaline phosphatase family protein [Planctomycetota bacterium]|nr:alkaline phosphatase family protein [Planctomycetota bacterium]